MKFPLQSSVDVNTAFADPHARTVYRTGRLDGIREVIAFLRGGMLQGNRAVWNKGDDAAAERFADRIAHEVARTMCPLCVKESPATRESDGTYAHHSEALGLPQVTPCKAAKWLGSIAPLNPRR